MSTSPLYTRTRFWNKTNYTYQKRKKQKQNALSNSQYNDNNKSNQIKSSLPNNATSNSQASLTEMLQWRVLTTTLTSYGWHFYLHSMSRKLHAELWWGPAYWIYTQFPPKTTTTTTKDKKLTKNKQTNKKQIHCHRVCWQKWSTHTKQRIKLITGTDSGTDMRQRHCRETGWTLSGMGDRQTCKDRNDPTSLRGEQNGNWTSWALLRPNPKFTQTIAIGQNKHNLLVQMFPKGDSVDV